MVFAQPGRPLGKLLPELAQYVEPRLKFHLVTLAVVESDGFDALVVAQGLRQAGGGILPTRKQHQRRGVDAARRGGRGGMGGWGGGHGHGPARKVFRIVAAVPARLPGVELKAKDYSLRNYSAAH